MSHDIAGHLDEIRVDAAATSAALGPWQVDATEPRDLEKKLGRVLYERLHLRRDLPLDTRARMVRDAAFESTLSAVLPADRVTVPVELIGDGAGVDEAVARLMGVRVRLPRAALSGPAGARVATARIPSSHPALSPGFLLFHGSRPVAVRAPGDLVRLYLGPRDAESAVRVWATTTALLDGIAHRAKVASVRWFHPRTDAITVYAASTDLDRLEGVAATVADRHGADLADRTSYLTRRLAPGIAVAHEPDDPEPGRRGLSFGEHRCSLLATAVVAGHQSGQGWRAHLDDVLTSARVDPDHLWRNTPRTDRTSPRAVVPPDSTEGR